MKYDYDLICIGLGPAGMAVSIMGSEMGLKVFAVEKHKIGGECMNCGCIPSKALLKIAEHRYSVSKFPALQLEKLHLPAVQKPFAKIAADLQFIGEKKNKKMFDKVDLILGKGSAKFINRHTVEADGRKLTARYIFAAVGTKPAILQVPGLHTSCPLTNENIFSLKEVPESLTILGGGAIACEMAQAFCRLGSKVTLIQRSKYILSRNDQKAAILLEKQLRKEGITLLTGNLLEKVEKTEDTYKITTKSGKIIESEKLLAATGRGMDFNGLQLENAGIKYDSKGIKVNKYLQTSARNIFAVGDCNGFHQFSHAAMHQGMIALLNAMTPIGFKKDFRKFVVPATIFTDPQISQVGMTEIQLQQKNIKYETHTAEYQDYGAAIAEELKTGFVKAFTSPLGKIYGVVIVGNGSGEMINEWALAIQKNMRLTEIMFLQHSFPTMGFLSKRVSENWMMRRMQPAWVKSLCRLAFRL
ncbi:NAD(P)/FAD-dependent oxidoreductase [Lentisphaerota bacterium ZTH]|nr:NAD(P)/FAD-dependent oxidoreductase [Lentisphaerota bacterium]WET05565.1 NAD(P)/FAD-dependent oxidoreductase [Lentisphaerota bacterium ZTH]